MRVLREVKKTDPISSKIMLRQAYENTFGVFNYAQQAFDESRITDPSLKRPLAIVGMNDAEDYCNTSKLYELVKVYADEKVYDYYHLSLQDFLDLPHDMCDFIIADCKLRRKKDDKANANLINSLQPGK